MTGDEFTKLMEQDLEEFQPERNSFQFAILMGLNSTGKHVYAGTVSPEEKARRRKANKAAKASRGGR